MRRIHKRGYVFIDGKAEHRVVMEAHIGRLLRADEAVHHVNGDKADNRVENLELMSVSDHVALHNRMQPRRIKGKVYPGDVRAMAKRQRAEDRRAERLLVKIHTIRHTDAEAKNA